MALGAISAICFDLDNTLWDVEPVLMRAERILTDWLETRYPRIPERFRATEVLEMRASLLREQPHQAHDLSFLRRETLARCAAAVGYDRDISHEAFAIWHAARNEVEPFFEVLPALLDLKRRFRLATLSNGNADLAVIGIAHHFEVSLSAGALGCAKPRPARLRTARRRADTETRANTVCRRRTARRCGRSTDSWHANCMGE